jgi:hypothetical protein
MIYPSISSLQPYTWVSHDVSGMHHCKTIQYYWSLYNSIIFADKSLLFSTYLVHKAKRYGFHYQQYRQHNKILKKHISGTLWLTQIHEKWKYCHTRQKLQAAPAVYWNGFYFWSSVLFIQKSNHVYAILECEKQRVLNISETTCYKLTVRMYWQHLIHHVRSVTQGMAVNHLITKIHTVILFYLTATVSHFPLTHFTHETPMCNNVLAEYDAYQQVDENH